MLVRFNASTVDIGTNLSYCRNVYEPDVPDMPTNTNHSLVHEYRAITDQEKPCDD